MYNFGEIFANALMQSSQMNQRKHEFVANLRLQRDELAQRKQISDENLAREDKRIAIDESKFDYEKIRNSELFKEDVRRFEKDFKFKEQQAAIENKLRSRAISADEARNKMLELEYKMKEYTFNKFLEQDKVVPGLLKQVEDMSRKTYKLKQETPDSPFMGSIKGALGSAMTGGNPLQVNMNAGIGTGMVNSKNSALAKEQYGGEINLFYDEVMKGGTQILGDARISSQLMAKMPTWSQQVQDGLITDPQLIERLQVLSGLQAISLGNLKQGLTDEK